MTIKPAQLLSEEALEAGEDLRQRLDFILASIALRTDLSAKDRERLIIEAKRRENALALDAFAAQRLSAALLDPSEEAVTALLGEFCWDNSPADREAARDTFRQVAGAMKLTGQ